MITAPAVIMGAGTQKPRSSAAGQLGCHGAVIDCFAQVADRGCGSMTILTSLPLELRITTDPICKGPPNTIQSFLADFTESAYQQVRGDNG